VLVVDDDMKNTYALAHALDERGLDVVMADNGKLALEKLEQEADVALIVMDIMMPVMDGYEAMRRIRGMTRYETVPIIALTAKAMPEDRSKCIAAGANDYLMKPVNIEELFSMMKIWLDSRR
jgi:CheY-like chemotaxis protein